MIKFRIPLLLLAASCLFSQTAERQFTTRALETNTSDGNRIEAIRMLVEGQLGSAHVEFHWFSSLKTMVLRGTRDDLDRAELFWKKYDVAPPPSHQVEFTAFLVQAWNAARYARAKPGEKGELKTDPLPSALDGAIAEMKNTFGYDRFALMEVNITHVRPNIFPSSPAEYEGVLGGADTRPDYYSLAYKNVSVEADGKTVDLGDFKFEVKAAHDKEYTAESNGSMAIRTFSTSSITNGVSIRDGQKLILGKIKLRPSDPTDLFLILTAKIQ